MGTALVGHTEVHWPLQLECEFEVTVRDDGIGSESLWLAPAR